MSNKIHPTAIIDKNVLLGNHNEIGPYSILHGPLELGDNNIISEHVTIGTPGQDTRNRHYDSSQSLIKIGSNNIIREFSTIQKPCYSNITSIENNVFIMSHAHISHDAIIKDDVTITSMVALAGISTIFTGANLAFGAKVHQYSVIGHYSIVAMGASVTKNIKPFSRYIPNKDLSINNYAIQKFGFESLEKEISEYVLNNKMPTSPLLKEIIMEFEKAHHASKRKLY